MHGENFILPVDLQSQAVKTKAQLKRSAISLDYMLSKLSSSLVREHSRDSCLSVMNHIALNF